MNQEAEFSYQDLTQIHRAFSTTEYGEQLFGRVRYEKYKPGEVSNEDWQKLLGADVNNLQHHTLTFNLTKTFIKYAEIYHPDLLDEQEKAVLGAAAITHDWGETSPLRDITYGDKTPENQQAEKAHFEDNLQHFLGADTKDARELIEVALQEVIFKTDSKLGMIFNAVERVGYLRTTLRAAKHIENGTVPVGYENGLKWLVADVLSNQTQKLIEYSNRFVPVDMYLFNMQQDINTAFHLITPEVFENYGPERQKVKDEEFLASKTAWGRWLLTSNS